MGVYQTYTIISLKKMKGELDKVELAVEVRAGRGGEA